MSLTASSETLTPKKKRRRKDPETGEAIPGIPTSSNDAPTPLFQSQGLGELFQNANYDVSDDELYARVNVSLQAGQDPYWDNLTAQLIQASCAFFAQELLTGPMEAPYNGRFLISEHHEEWDELVTKHRRLCILAPRDHGKTFFFNFAYPLWKAWTIPNGSGYIFSATADQAEIILDAIKNEIENNPRLQWLKPRKKSLWSKRAIRLTNGHRIYARGFGTRVRGAHPHWIVVDDALNDETAYSETVRKKQNDYFYTAITNMIIPTGQIVVVGTPFHAADLYGELENNTQYKFKRYRALNDDGEPLWPDRYSKERLEARREEIGSIRFGREFQCVPIADEMSLFPRYLFVGTPTEQPTLKLGMSASFWNKLGIVRFMGVDFAMSSNVKADYTVIWVMGLDKHGNRWIVDIFREKGLGYQDQLSHIVRMARKYDPALIYLEANQMQRIFGDELIRTTDLPIKKFTTGVEKNTLDKGVPSLRVLLENGKFRIPRGDRRSVELTDTWINEMRNFTFTEGKLQSVGTHDDTVMGCWICDQAVRQGGFSFSFGEGEDANADLEADLMGEEEVEAAQEDLPMSPEEEEVLGNLIDDESYGLALAG